MTIDTELIWVLLVGLLTALVALVGGIAMIARALTKSSETNIKLNNELQEHSKERREWEAARQSWQLERVKFEAEIKALRTNYTNDVERLERQLSGMTAQVAQIRQQRDRLQGEFDGLKQRVIHLEGENKELRGKIAALETENKDLKGERAVLIEKLDALTRRLEAEIDNNNDLRCELDKLRASMNGDDPPPDPDPPLGPRPPIKFEGDTETNGKPDSDNNDQDAAKQDAA